MSSKSRSLKSSGKRSFTIHSAHHVDGCPTKFSHNDYTGRFTAHTPDRAARKAISLLCHKKKIRGQCTLYIEMRETTQGSSHKVFTYKGKRIHLSKPIEIGTKGEEGYRVIHYQPIVKAVDRVPTEKCSKSHKSSGRMTGYHSKMLSDKKHSGRHSVSKKSRSMTKRASNAVHKSSKIVSNAVRKTMKRIRKIL
jgi:hypothetical protein